MSAHQHQPPRSPDTYGRHGADAESRWRRIAASPFFIVSVVVAGFLLLGVLLVIAAGFQGAPPLVVPGAMRATMPNGSRLWLKVTSGTQHDFVFEYPESGMLARIFDPTSARHVNTHTDDNRFVIWLMRQDPVTGGPLDVEWWSHSTVVDEYGEEVRDRNPHRNAYHTYGSRGEGGRRPFSPLGPEEYIGVVAHSELPLFRHTGQTFTLRIHNTDGEVVARFAVPYELPFQPPNWSPEELPVAKSRGELSVTLQDVAFEEYEHRVNNRPQTGLRVRPNLEIAFGGETAQTWNAQPVRVFDPLGNSASPWQCDLDRHEPAWKLSVLVARTSEAEFSPEETWPLPPLEVPNAGRQQLLNEQTALQGARFRLMALGGAGKSVFHSIDPERRSGGASSSGSFRTAEDQYVNYEIDVEYQNGTKTVSVECPLPYLAFEVTGIDDDQSLVVRGMGRGGQPIPTHVNSVAGDLRFAFLEVPAMEKQVDLALILHRTHEFEFFIQPPREPAEDGN